MKQRRPIRLDREMVIDAALRITDMSKGSGRALTGRALGEELGVDRSAIWRHFQDREDLLLAVGDSLLAPVVAQLEVAESSAERLRTIWNTSIETALRYPHIASEVGGRFNAGPHTVRSMELLLEALSELGFSSESAALESRAFADMTLGYAAMIAHYTLHSDSVAGGQQMRLTNAVSELKGAGHRQMQAAIGVMVTVDLQAADLVFDNYLRGLLSKVAV